MKRLLFIAMLTAGALCAQEKSGEGGDHDAGWRWANFALLVGGLGYLMAKELPPFFRSRTSEIQMGIVQAQKAKSDAERRAAEMEARLKALGGEIEKFIAQSHAEMEQEGERIRQETAKQVARLQQQAEQEIETAGKIARRALQAHAAKLSLSLAEERIRARLDSATEAGLVEDFVKDLGASKN